MVKQRCHIGLPSACRTANGAKSCTQSSKAKEEEKREAAVGGPRGRPRAGAATATPRYSAEATGAATIGGRAPTAGGAAAPYGGPGRCTGGRGHQPLQTRALGLQSWRFNFEEGGHFPAWWP